MFETERRVASGDGARSVSVKPRSIFLAARSGKCKRGRSPARDRLGKSRHDPGENRRGLGQRGGLVALGPELLGREVAAIDELAADGVVFEADRFRVDRIQTADPMFFEMFGLDIAKAARHAVTTGAKPEAGDI